MVFSNLLTILNKGLKLKVINTIYINNIKKSPESTNSIPNFSLIKNPMNAENKAATPPDTISYWGEREYFNLEYNFSFLKKLDVNKLNRLLKSFHE